ncbi:MAG: hypothetical protein MUC91_04305, partial [Verrucomicrobia bacterium]|nr:hypothetical protein [Verrucomicrobiota bacterium]
MPAPAANVSVTEPISPALKRVKDVLFSPFDLNKWLVIGFCAWLSSCAEGGGGGGGGGGHGRSQPSNQGDLRKGLETAWDYVRDNLAWILPLLIFLIVLGVTLWVVATWLNSRGKFMLLHCVALNRAEVQVPWNQYTRHAQSLFLFQLCLGAL